jgi:hypothetical protein
MLYKISERFNSAITSPEQGAQHEWSKILLLLGANNFGRVSIFLILVFSRSYATKLGYFLDQTF